MAPQMLANESNAPDPEYVESFAQIVNRYGFMVIFSVIVLILIIIFFVTFNARASKKSDSELKILQTERMSSIAQTEKIFDLVTNVQTQQISQLQEMTDTLKDMNISLQEDNMKLMKVNDNFEKLKESVMKCDENSKTILKTIYEILNYIETSQKCNQEMLEKVNMLEKTLITKTLDNQ